ncbi:MAG: PKD domain-containing protein, partial [Burkholderiales bacterium]
MGNYLGWLRPLAAILSIAIVVSGCVENPPAAENDTGDSLAPGATELIPNPRNPLINEAVIFIVRCTGSNISRRWEFGDGATSNAISPSHSYSRAGTYTVRATCSDSQGRTAFATTDVVVGGTARLDARFTVTPSNNLALGADATFTPAASGLNYSWQFGDGSNGSGSPASHKYTSSGSYTAVLDVTDGRGNSAQSSQTISVAARNPGVSLTPANITGRNGKALTFTANASDPGGNSLSYNWDFGDGTQLAGGGATASHSYATNGNYVVSVTVDNGKGGTASASGSVQIVDNRAPDAPVINVGEHQPVGETIPFGVSSSDPDGDTLTYLWDFGDGQTSSASAPSHAYPVVGQYVVRVTVTDEQGASSSAAVTLSVVDFASVSGRPCVGVQAGQGWCMQNPLPTRYRLNAIDMADSNSGWAVGLNGTIVRTVNGGVSWLNQYTGTSAALNALRTIDANTAWAAGDHGVILKTTDGGSTWAPQSSGASVSLQGLTALDANTAWAVGAEGVIVKTTDGGATWQRQSSGVPDALTAVYALDANRVWAVGVAGTFLFTNDGGANWVVRCTAASDIFRSVHAADSNTVWISGASGSSGGLGSLLLKSTDGGLSWTPQTAASNEMLNRVVVADASNVWLTGADGKLYRTTDGGSNWTQVSSG